MLVLCTHDWWTTQRVTEPSTIEPRWFARFPAMASSDFRRLFVNGFYTTGSRWAQVLARGWLVHELTDGSSGAVGWVTFASFIPFVIVGPFAGAIADRFDRRKLLIGATLFGPNPASPHRQRRTRRASAQRGRAGRHLTPWFTCRWAAVWRSLPQHAWGRLGLCLLCVPAVSGAHRSSADGLSPIGRSTSSRPSRRCPRSSRSVAPPRWRPRCSWPLRTSRPAPTHRDWIGRSALQLHHGL